MSEQAKKLIVLVWITLELLVGAKVYGDNNLVVGTAEEEGSGATGSIWPLTPVREPLDALFDRGGYRYRHEFRVPGSTPGPCTSRNPVPMEGIVAKMVTRGVQIPARG